MRFVNYCIPFLFTICTVSQLFWNRVCTLMNTLIKCVYIYIYTPACCHSLNRYGVQIFSSHSARSILNIKSFCPPSRLWASLELHFAGLSLTSQVGTSDLLGEPHQLVTGFLRDQFSDPSSSHHTGTWLFLPLLCWWMNEWCIYIALYCVLLYTQSTFTIMGGGGGGGVSPQPPPDDTHLYISFKPDDPTVPTRISDGASHLPSHHHHQYSTSLPSSYAHQW